MNRLLRNILVVLMGTVSSVGAAVFLVFLEGRSGQPLFSYSLWTYVPVGAMGAGLVGAVGYLAGSLLLRQRLSLFMLPVFLAVAAGTVYVAESAEFGLMMTGSRATTDLATYGHFLGNAVLHSPLRFGLGVGDGERASSSSSSSSSEASGAAPMPQVAGSGDAGVQGIGGGVQNMLAAGDPSKIAATSRPMAQINRLSDGLDSLGSMGQSVAQMDGAKLVVAGLQVAGFLIGGLMVFGFVRSLAYCDECSLLLNRKGARTRYFVREHEAKRAVDDFLEMARARQLQQSIKEHLGKGTGEEGRFAEFASTIEVQRCAGCERHRVSFSARRKAGGSWKDIPLLGYAASSLEPVDVV